MRDGHDSYQDLIRTEVDIRDIGEAQGLEITTHFIRGSEWKTDCVVVRSSLQVCLWVRNCCWVHSLTAAELFRNGQRSSTDSILFSQVGWIKTAKLK